ncbi:hypothetical protein [Hyunsoonleella pacifica]|uniref:Uncharacterized protein n=1 Tax=Hyunsoonleella pacifica TaxID=1080224 RepID=A0A4Q9FN20_9FLAO|nr:hypothetical protein [Hyunsoonleella pacifica]TBN15748.1 hypothetical protein EYD46_11545 [Hyunsoonleella pacifica]GGD22262.1 hypothetical protein GCM10011368_25470 [Hyunsoonleella pacifica]
MKYSFFICLLWFSFSFSQVKDEKEERISLSEFPKIAQNYFSNFSDQVKYLKFYRETDGEKQSFEAKFKIHKLYYSAEFDALGKLEDIEIVIKKRHIAKEVLTRIMAYFEANYKKTRLLKIQKQYVNHTNTNDKSFIQHIVDNPNDRYTHFEIIAETKTEKLRELSEFTFNKNGNFESSRKVTSSSYEHALY